VLGDVDGLGLVGGLEVWGGATTKIMIVEPGASVEPTGGLVA